MAVSAQDMARAQATGPSLQPSACAHAWPFAASVTSELTCALYLFLEGYKITSHVHLKIKNSL